MKISRTLTIILLGLTLATASPAGKTIDAQNYTISPSGRYYYIRLIPRQEIHALGDLCTDDGGPGTLYYNARTEGRNALMFCESQSDEQNRWTYLPGVWSLSEHSALYADTKSYNAVTFEADTDTTPYFNIGSTDPLLNLTITENGGILAAGSEQSQDSLLQTQPFFNLFAVKASLSELHTVPSGNPTGFPLFWWYAAKGAFRAQYMRVNDSTSDYNNLWDQNSLHQYQGNDGNIGYYSAALGDSNIAAGRASFVAGSHNQAWDHLSSIISGKDNRIQTVPSGSAIIDDLQQRFGSTIIGGTSGRINGPRNFIGGGNGNTIEHANSCAIAGGTDNTISDYDPESSSYNDDLFNYDAGSHQLNDLSHETHSIILGGERNTNSGRRSAIGGGQENTIDTGALYCAVMSGDGNRIGSHANHSAISGGGGDLSGSDGRLENNLLDADFSVLLSTQEGPQDTNHNAIALNSNHSVLIRPAGLFTNGTLDNDSDFIVAVGGADSFLGHHSVSLLHQHPDHIDLSLDADYAAALGGGISAEIFSGSDYSVAVNNGPHISMNGAAYSLATNTGDNTGASMSAGYAVSHGNKSSGNYSYTWTRFPGGCSGHTNQADNSFLFGICPDRDLATDNRFIIYGSYDHDNSSWTPDLTLNVGIGTTSPAKTLDVAGKIRANSFQVGNAALPSTGSVESLYLNRIGAPEIYRYDLAEVFPAQEPIETGDLVAVSPKHPGRLVKTRSANDPWVVGVASDTPAVVLEGGRTVIAPDPATKDSARPWIALAGRTLIKVCAENGPIQRGDLLTASSIPGVAMKAERRPQAGHTIIAKALENFTPKNAEGSMTGTIVGLVMIR